MFVKFLIYYLLPWPEDNQWHNESPLRTKAENMRPSNKQLQIYEIKNRRKIKDRTFAIVTLFYWP